MNEFRSNIKSGFSKNSIPVFSDDKWNAFEKFRDDKKKRPKRIAIWFFLLGLGLLGATYFLFPSNIAQEKPTIQSSEVADNSFTNKIDKISNTLSEAVPTNTKTEHNVIYKSYHQKETEFNERVQNLSLENQNITIEKENRLKKAIETITDHQINSPNNLFRQDKFETIINLSSLPTSFQLIERNQNLSIVIPLAIQPFSKFIPVQKDRRPSLMIQGYIGISGSNKLNTVEEQAYQFGAKSYLFLGKYFRPKFGVHFSSINFILDDIDQELGIRNVSPPNDEVEFKQVVVESFALNLEVGLDYSPLQNTTIQPYVGLAYSISKEIVKEVEYEFVGEDDDSSEDDVFISDATNQKFFIPHILHFETGIQYNGNDKGLNVSITIPYQLGNRTIKIPSNFQFNLGLNKKF